MKKICIIWASSWIGLALAEYYKKTWEHVDVFTRETADLSVHEDIIELSQNISQWDYNTVIFSAWVWYHKSFRLLSSDQISEQVFVNTLAPLQILRTLPQKTKFVYLSSVMQYIPAKNMAVYAAMKRATSHALTTLRYEEKKSQILCVDLWAVKTPMHIKAGMKKMVWKDIETVIPKLVQAIENKQGTTTLFLDWFLMMHIVFPLMRIFLKIKG